jgi:predicted MPP superfamily phosphohydrolase
MMLTVLHISDLHFSRMGRRSVLPAIAETLLLAVRNQDWQPDLYVISGDIVFSGKDEEFELASNLVERLLSLFRKMRICSLFPETMTSRGPR